MKDYKPCDRCGIMLTIGFVVIDAGMIFAPWYITKKHYRYKFNSKEQDLCHDCQREINRKIRMAQLEVELIARDAIRLSRDAKSAQWDKKYPVIEHQQKREVE